MFCLYKQIVEELAGIGWGAEEVEALWPAYEEARKAEEKAKEKWAGRFRAWG